MKVCTDACVLGAVADLTAATRILDIGAGTGLLALMAAQRNARARVEAVELDPAAAAQAAANAARSPWSARIKVHAASLAQYAALAPARFDHILCNPPFFRHSLRSPDAQRTTARHTAPDTLSFPELAEFTARFLTADGRLTVLLPPPEMLHFEREAALAGLFLAARLTLRHRPGSKALRHISSFTLRPQPQLSRELAIHEADSEAYSAEFRTLLQDFYLAF
ncbi:methyltransferase domain-containing protein [Hymenobacter persicinus]|uniref:tRNA1(Val) (adenine(37)-N6)-methyltransferase n=2 Tax=Hymenobacter persicinus TaxID=2025506 RepID=A0A4Q5LB88_9BACT|nr:methyltransferase domain-containing protein [Hymenobacter persicinus]